MENVIEIALVVTSVILAAVSGFCLWCWYGKKMLTKKMKQKIIQSDSTSNHSNQAQDVLLKHMSNLSKELSLGETRAFCSSKLSNSTWFVKHASKAGIAQQVTEQGFTEFRFRLAAGGVLGGALVGACVSPELAIFMMCAGGVCGWRAPKSSVLRAEEDRTRSLEAHLPEMLDVMRLALKSGMGFDTALVLYANHFKTTLSEELIAAQRVWQMGLKKRDEALRDLAQTYNSPTLDRVVDLWNRSLHLGTSLSEGMEAEAKQARVLYKSQCEERIAKAPVKMMVPTGVLILPAMLLMVLGPILIELTNGGFK